MIFRATIMALGLLLAAPALAQGDPRLAECQRAADPTPGQLQRCEAISADPAADAPSRDRAERRAQEIRLGLNQTHALLAGAERRLSRDPNDARALDEKATALLWRGKPGDLQQALAAVELGLRQHPRDASLLATQVFVFNTMGRLNEAVTAGAAALAIAPRDPHILRARSFAYLRLGNRQAALADIEAALAVAPEDLGVLRTRAQIAFLLENWNDAIQLSDKVIARLPGAARNFVLRGMARAAQGDWRNAAVDFDAAVERDPNEAEFHFRRAQALMRIERTADALKALDRALELEPDHFWSRNDRAAIRLEMRDLAGAAADNAVALRLNPKESRARLTEGRLAMEVEKDKELPRALALFDALVKDDPGFAPAHVHRGISLMRLNRHEEAVSAFAEAIRLEPARGRNYAGRGEALVHAGKPNEALPDLNKAIELGHRPADVLFLRGLVHQRLGQYALSMADYEAVLRVVPTHHQSLNNRALIAVEQGDFSQGERDAREAIRLTPNEIAPRVTLARIIRDREKDLPRALRMLDEALVLKPDNAAGNFHRGVTLLRMGRAGDALDALNRALAGDSQNRLFLATRGEAYYLLERRADAMADFNRAITLGLDAPSTFFFRGLLHFLNKDYENASADIDTSIVRDPTKAPPQALKALLVSRAGTPFQAMLIADRALEIDPKNLMALNVKMRALEKLMRTTEAAEIDRRARSIDAAGHASTRRMVQDFLR